MAKNPGIIKKDDTNKWDRKTEGYALSKLSRIRESRDYAAVYLAKAHEYGRPSFLLAVRDLIRAYGGPSEVARLANIRRESIYRSFSKNGNPTLNTLVAVLNALGLDLSIIKQQERPEGDLFVNN